MSNYYSTHFVITFWGKGSGISFSKSIVRQLGYPTYISIRVTEDLTSLAVVPSEANEVLSFRVPEKLFVQRPVFRIYSKSFLNAVMAANQLDRSATYQCEGRYNPDQNAVVFTLADMKLK